MSVLYRVRRKVRQILIVFLGTVIVAAVHMILGATVYRVWQSGADLGLW